MIILYVLQALSTLLLMADCIQTLGIKNNPNLYEVNVLLGKHPSDVKIITYFTLCVASLLGVTYYYQNIYSVVGMSLLSLLELFVIRNNLKNGLSLNYRQGQK